MQHTSLTAAASTVLDVMGGVMVSFVPTWLGSSTQLFNQMQAWALLSIHCEECNSDSYSPSHLVSRKTWGGDSWFPAQRRNCLRLSESTLVYIFSLS